MEKIRDIIHCSGWYPKLRKGTLPGAFVLCCHHCLCLSFFLFAPHLYYSSSHSLSSYRTFWFTFCSLKSKKGFVLFCVVLLQSSPYDLYHCAAKGVEKNEVLFCYIYFLLWSHYLQYDCFLSFSLNLLSGFTFNIKIY